jgi:hypothetical protein
MFLSLALFKVENKTMEINGHNAGTGSTVYHYLPAVELHAVKIWIVVLVLVRDRATAFRYER